MSFALCYWILMLIWLVFGIWQAGPSNYKLYGGHILLFILLVLIGWKAFGPPIH